MKGSVERDKCRKERPEKKLRKKKWQATREISSFPPSGSGRGREGKTYSSVLPLTISRKREERILPFPSSLGYLGTHTRWLSQDQSIPALHIRRATPKTISSGDSAREGPLSFLPRTEGPSIEEARGAPEGGERRGESGGGRGEKTMKPFRSSSE